MKKLSPATRAKLRNQRDAQRLPLLAGTPLLEEVLGRPQWTAESVAADDERHRQAVTDFYQQAAARHQARYAFYRAWLVDLLGEAEVQRLEAERAELVARWPCQGQGEYQTDWLCGLVAQAAGLTKLEVFQVVQTRSRHDLHLARPQGAL